MREFRQTRKMRETIRRRAAQLVSVGLLAWCTTGCALRGWPPVPLASPMVSAGAFEKIYDPSIGEPSRWYMNDHCLIRDESGEWHMFGITHAEPADPLNEKHFAHATARTLTQQPWTKQPFGLSARTDLGERLLWAPHVIQNDGQFYMFYVAGDQDSARFKIHLATSPDLRTWTRHPKNPMVVDGYDARDPFILRVGDQWVMYYTATTQPRGGHHIVAYRTSRDLVTWGERGIAYQDRRRGTFGGPTESPFIVRRGEFYYLFIGPRGRGRGFEGEYVGTDVFRSRDPFLWTATEHVGFIASHAAEVVRDEDGRWYVTHAGWGQGGLFLAPLTWHDGLEAADTSMPVPTSQAAGRARTTGDR